MSENLWFRFPAFSQPSGDSDPFVVALLLLAMQNGEDIEVKGSLSRKFCEGLDRYQRVFQDWFPDRFKLIEVRASSFRDDAAFGSDGQGRGIFRRRGFLLHLSDAQRKADAHHLHGGF